MRIAILTFHRSNNCGAMLQAWALQTYLEKLGHCVSFPNCNAVCDRRFKPRPRRRNPVKAVYHGLRWVIECMLSIGFLDIVRYRCRKWRSANLKMVNVDVRGLQEAFDVVVVGSDQVWNPALMCARDYALFLGEAIPPSVPKIGYAVSIGDAMLPSPACIRMRRAAETYSALSVREDLVNTCLGRTRENAYHKVEDPTLLLTAADFNRVAVSRRLHKPRYLFVYALDVSNALYKAAHGLARKLGVDCVITAVYQTSKFGLPWDVKVGVAPDEFLAYIRDAEYVIAASFHGTALAIIYGKPFLSWRNQVDHVESRPARLLKSCNLTDHLVNPGVSHDVLLQVLRRPLTSDLTIDRAGSGDWLKNAIESAEKRDV